MALRHSTEHSFLRQQKCSQEACDLCSVLHRLHRWTEDSDLLSMKSETQTQSCETEASSLHMKQLQNTVPRPLKAQQVLVNTRCEQAHRPAAAPHGLWEDQATDRLPCAENARHWKPACSPSFLSSYFRMAPKTRFQKIQQMFMHYLL